MRELSELTDVEEPAWPLLSEAIAASGVSMEVPPVDPDLGRASLLQLQVTARSWLGGMVLWLTTMWKAASGEAFRLPLAADWADRINRDS